MPIRTSILAFREASYSRPLPREGRRAIPRGRKKMLSRTWSVDQAGIYMSKNNARTARVFPLEGR